MYFCSDRYLFLIRKGIPSPLRSSIWTQHFPNPLHITADLYDSLLDRLLVHPPPPAVIRLIQGDLQRSGKWSSEIAGLRLEVSELLQLFHLHRPDISYVQGMTYPALILTQVVGRVQAFIIFSNLVTRGWIGKMYSFKNHSVKIICKAVEYLLKDRLPEIASRLIFLGIDVELFIV